ncbi:Manganese/iron superoxide dismutase [Protomyces lactucae-debilis]|uniref:Manganese/iron superoxide dismutase n=1 Tax=Protomyces lactucae-debilis TaxID=2754530 RepID=A0A1Y2FWL3_PROLT|nr:Manganese/iron superoxide dismutase [Protomyces lactucae-debilis]ORY87045.1 Manganese/iron superoxide dismutase [Protomyces lactucae-debilis]
MQRIQPTLRACSQASSFRRRLLHSVPQLRLATSADGQEGFEPLYSASGYKQAWTDYQAHVVENLNRLSVDTDYESMPLINVIAQTSRKPELAALHNYAAQAFSNHFYFDALNVAQLKQRDNQPSDQHTIPKAMRLMLQASGMTAEGLGEHFAATANAMIGSGWIWLVLDEQDRLRVLATYNAGTPFDLKNLRNVDPNTGLAPSSQASANKTAEESKYSLYTNVKRSLDLVPVACLSVWEHSYLADYGVAGKQAYVEQWIKTLDWKTVTDRMTEAQRSGSGATAHLG